MLEELDTYMVCRSQRRHAQCLSVPYLQPRLLAPVDEVNKYLFDGRAVFCLNCVSKSTCRACGMFHCPGCAAYRLNQAGCDLAAHTTTGRNHELLVQCESCHVQVCQSNLCSTTCTNCKETTCSECIENQGLAFSTCNVCETFVHHPPVFCLELNCLCQRCYSREIVCTSCSTIVPEPETWLIDLMIAVASIPFPFEVENGRLLHNRIFMMAFGDRFIRFGASRFEDSQDSLAKLERMFQNIMDHVKVRGMRQRLQMTPFYPVPFTGVQGIPWFGANDPEGRWLVTLRSFHRAVHDGISSNSSFPTLGKDALTLTRHIAQSIEHGRMVDLPGFFHCLGISGPSTYLWSRIGQTLVGLEYVFDSTEALSIQTLSCIIRCVTGRIPLESLHRAIFSGRNEQTGRTGVTIWTIHERYIYVLVRLYIALRRARINVI